MVQSSPLVLLLRFIPRASGKSLVSRCHRLWTILWRFLQRCFPFLFKRWRSVTFPPRNASKESFGGNNQRLGVSDARPTGDTQILASLIPTHTSQSRQSGHFSISRPSLINSSSGISVNVVPPDDDTVSVTSSQLERISSRDDSMTIHSGNDMASQTFKVLSSGANGSRASLVLPVSPSLVPSGDDLGPGASRGTGFSQGISEHIYPLMPYKVPRYKRKRFIKDEPATFEVSANQVEFSLEGELPEGWKQVTHPEGQPYFYHDEKRIITECWIWDRQMSMILDDFIDQFEDFTRSRNVTQPNDVDLLLEVNIEDGVNWCGYYYSSASTHSVFWLEPFDISDHVSEARGDMSPTHIKLYLEFQYWFHWDLFPNISKTTDDTYDLVANTIADARTDVQSSLNSTVNQTKDELKEMAEVVKEMQIHKASASNWCLGRFMQLLTRDRFINYHGQYGARLDSSQSIHRDKNPRQTWFIKISSPLLLFAPTVTLRRLNELWVDQITIRPRWVKFFAEMNKQWGEHIFHASILLNANVAFLAIPSNDPSNNSRSLKSTRRGAQVSSYLSIVFSFSSMLLGLMLVLQHRAKERDIKLDVKEYHKYLHAHFSQKFGFEKLAIMYSLPYALLAWGMGTFYVAFLLMCLVKSTTAVRSIIAIATAIICVFILWCICMFWDESTFQCSEKHKSMWNRLTASDKNKKQDFESATTQGESRDDNAGANENRLNHNTGSTKQVVIGRGNRWRGVWLQGNARPTVTCKNNDIPLSPV